MAVGRRVKRTRRGSFELRIPDAERDVLRTLPGQLRELITQADPLEDPVMRRLYPAAYLDDPEAAAEFDGFVRDDLTAQRMSSIETMARTVDARSLGADELAAWLGAINDLRLILGVRLGVTEESEPGDFDGEPEREASYALYSYLSYLEEEIVQALAEG
jgi:hypothetical protein